MGLSLTTAAASLPVVLADITPELLSYTQSTANDAVVTQKLTEAVNYVEGQTQRCFIQSTWLQTFDDWPPGPIKIDLQPLSSVSHVKYYDVDGTLQTVSSSLYWTDTNSKPPRIVFKPDFTWPAVEVGRPSAVQVTFVAGYANAAAVPAMAKAAIKMLAAYWLERPEAASVDGTASASGTASNRNGSEIPYGVMQMINMLRCDGYT